MISSIWVFWFQGIALKSVTHHSGSSVTYLAGSYLSITLRQQLRGLAGGLMPRTVFEKLATVQMLDVRVPTTDGRELLLIRRTEPAADVTLVLQQLGLELPAQPPPRIRTPAPFKSPV